MSPTAESESVATTIPTFSLTRLFASPLNPRKRFTPESLADLQANIQRRGEVIQPLLLRTNGDRFEIIDGERRWRAATGAGNILWVPGQVRDDLTDGECIEIMLLSSIQKQDLTPLEEAHGFKALIDSNPSRYSRAYIGDRIGRSEKWVWDRMKLLDLEPLVKQLLEAQLIGVGHAEVLAKLKWEDQLHAIAVDADGYPKGGLFERAASRLGFDATDDEDDDDYHDEDDSDPLARYRSRLKARTVKELEAWIASHVRFDVQHAAAAAPLDFGVAAQQVEEAEALPGRGKKVVEITFESQVPPDTRGDAKMLTAWAWKRADGSNKEAPECEFSVLGVVAAGRQYGKTFQVCAAKDKCAVHWKDEIKEREKNQKLRAQGKGGQANQREVVTEAARREKEDRERQERIARAQAWEALEPLILAEAIAQAKKAKAITAAQAKALNDVDIWQPHQMLSKHLGSTWFKTPVAAFLVLLVASTGVESFDDYVKTVAKPAGLDIKKLEAVRDKHAPKAEPKGKPATPAKAVKKAKKR